MFVGVVHRITACQKFAACLDELMEAGLPDAFTIPWYAPSIDGQLAIAVWDGPSLAAVRDLVEAVVADHSANEYFEVGVEGANALGFRWKWRSRHPL